MCKWTNRSNKIKSTYYDLVYRMYFTMYTYVDEYELFYDYIKGCDMLTCKMYFMRIIVILL